MPHDAVNDPQTNALVAAARRLHGENTPALPAESLPALLFQRASETPQALFLGFAEEGGGLPRWWTYSAFAGVVAQAAASLRQHGVMPGDRVAALMGNDPRTVFLYFAAWTVGATVVPLNASEDDDRLRFILENAQAKALFARDEYVSRAESLCAALPSVAFAPVGAGWPGAVAALTPPALRATLSRFAGESEEQKQGVPVLPSPAWAGEGGLPEASRVRASTEALLIYTSGTTGPPKGVVLEQGNLLADAQAIAEWHGFGPGDRALCVLPLHHVNGIVVTLCAPLVSGGSVFLSRKFQAGTFWQTLASEGCTWTSVVPTILAFLCERAEAPLAPQVWGEETMQRGARLTLSPDLGGGQGGGPSPQQSAADHLPPRIGGPGGPLFRHIICGAGPLTTDLAARFDRTFGLRVVHGYGLSETTCYSCFLPVDLSPQEYAYWMTECGFPSIGCPLPVNEMAVHDDSGKPLPAEARGEIVARGPNVMRGYFGRPDANAQAFAHGWFRSGDEGFYRVGQDGRAYFFITGRLKELIIRGGVNYSPFDIDEVLNAIPGVRAAMAVGFDHALYGEEIGAYVQTEPGATLTEADILRACREKLSWAKSPKVALFGDTFPVTSTGKYQRGKLRPLFAAYADADFRERG